MDWNQISRNWDEMTRRIQPQSSLPSTGLFGGQSAPSMDKEVLKPATQAVDLVDRENEASAADTLV